MHFGGHGDMVWTMGRGGHVMEGSGKPLHPAKPQKVKIGIGRRSPARRSVSYASGASNPPSPG